MWLMALHRKCSPPRHLSSIPPTCSILPSPGSLIRGKEGLGVVEIGYRHSTATSIYGGTSEVLRSMVAERRLNLPRSRA